MVSETERCHYACFIMKPYNLSQSLLMEKLLYFTLISTLTPLWTTQIRVRFPISHWIDSEPFLAKTDALYPVYVSRTKPDLHTLKL